jgi:IMP dehydrogenase
MAENKIGGIPVVISKERKLKGIVTNRDLRFEKKLNKKIAEVMTTENLVTANEDVDL